MLNPLQAWKKKKKKKGYGPHAILRLPFCKLCYTNPEKANHSEKAIF